MTDAQWIDELVETAAILRDLPAEVRASIPAEVSVETAGKPAETLAEWLRAAILEKTGNMTAPALARLLKQAAELDAKG